MAINGGTDGADGTEYRMEIDGFSRIVSYGVAGSGPRHFRAWLKSGRVMEFGGTEDSRIEAPGKPSAHAWALNRLIDASGNYLTVTYQEDTADGAYRPLRVDYTGNDGAGLAPTRRVEFAYAPRLDVKTRFIAGSRTRLTNRLMTVSAYAGSTLARRYVLGYLNVAAPSGGGAGLAKDVLELILECGDGSGGCLPMWVFGQEWGRSELSFGASLPAAMIWRSDTAKTFAADVNGDGLTDLIQVKMAANQARVLLADGTGGFTLAWTSPTSSTASGFVRSSNAYAIALADVNGDGRADLIQVGKTTAGAFVLLGNADGSFTTAWTSPPSGDGSVYTAQRVIAVDLNADGRVDLMLIRSTNEVRTLISRGDGSFTTAWNSIASPALSGFLYGAASAVTYVGDVNGDRVPDVLQITLGSNFGRVLLGTGDGSFVTTWTSPAASTADGFIWPAQSGQTAVGDFNGDGLMDVIQVHPNQNMAQVLLARGDGGFTTAWVSPAASGTDGYLLSAAGALTLVGDVDGDGKADLVQVYKNLNQAKVLLSRGDGSFTDAALSSTSGQGGVLVFNSQPTTGDHLLVDVTGDGSVDLVQIRKTIDTGHQVIKLGTGLSGALWQARSPLGRTTQIGWGFITDPTVHARETGSVYPTSDRPRPEPVVATLRTFDASTPGDATDTVYAYGGVKYDLLGRGSLGFRWRRVTEQAPGGATATTFFKQQFPETGSVEASELRDGTGGVLRTTANQWSHVATSPKSFFVRLDQADASECEASGGCRQTSQSFQYDAFGNLERAYHFGDAAVSGDERDEYTEWIVDVNAWLHRPRRVAAFGAGGQLLREQWVSYDGLSYGTLGARGLPTRDERRLKGDRGTPGNFVVTTAYDPGLGTLSAVTDARGCTTTVLYESAHRTYPETLTTCLNHVTKLAYDPRSGNVTSHEDPNAQVTTYQYDALGRLTRVVGPLDGASTYGSLSVEWLSMGSADQRVVTRRTQQHGTSNAHWTEEYFDGLGRVRRVRAQGPAGQVIESETTYDARGLLTSRSIPHFTGESAAGVSYTYDVLRRITKVVNPDGTFVTTAYAPGLQTVTDERQKITRYGLDAFDRIVRVEEVNDAATYTTTYAYDAVGTLLQARNHLGHVTEVEPDYLGRPVTLSDPSLGQWTFDVDASGDLRRQTDAKSQTVTFDYDSHGRIRTKTYPNGSSIGWAYDDPVVPYSKGRLTRVVDLATTTALRYDPLGRVTQAQRTLDGTTYTMTFTHDAVGRITREVFPDGDIVDYGYDEVGGLLSVRDGATLAPYVTSASYNARGQSTQIQYANGVTSTFSYFDDATAPRSFRLKEMLTSGPAGVLQSLAYAYDAAGNVRDITDGAGTAGRHYEYDSLGRLVQASGTFGLAQAPVTETYAYDAAGNMLNKGGVVYAYSDPTRPSAVTARSDGREYAYDANGNITRVEPGRSHEWDVDNQLSRVTMDAGPTVAFAYDASGRRVRKTNGASTTRYPFRGYDVDPAGVVSKSFAGVLKRSDGSVFFTHADHLDGVHVLSGPGGVGGQVSEYGPWGDASRVQGAVDTSRGFTGQEADAETQLLYYGGRYYDPVLGRFISADPIGGVAAAPQSWNRYSYVLNRPTRFTDPTGFICVGLPFNEGAVRPSVCDGGGGDDGGDDDDGGGGGGGTAPAPKPIDPGPAGIVEPKTDGGGSVAVSAEQVTGSHRPDLSTRPPVSIDLTRTIFIGSRPSDAGLTSPAPRTSLQRPREWMRQKDAGSGSRPEFIGDGSGRDANDFAGSRNPGRDHILVQYARRFFARRMLDAKPGTTVEIPGGRQRAVNLWNMLRGNRRFEEHFDRNGLGRGYKFVDDEGRLVLLRFPLSGDTRIEIDGVKFAFPD